MYKEDLAPNDLQELTWHKIQPNLNQNKEKYLSCDII